MNGKPTICPDFVRTPSEPGIYLAEDGGGNVTAIRLLNNGDVIQLGSDRIIQPDDFTKLWKINIPEAAKS